MPFLEKMRQGEICFGTWITFFDPTVTEVLSQCGFDFLFLDTEHAPMTPDLMQNHLLALKGSGVTSIVRVPWNDRIHIKWILDIGADGIMVPTIRSADELREAVDYSHYPPMGSRGLGPRRPAQYERRYAEYVRRANDEVILVAMIEHIDGVRDIERIVQVRGLTALMLGFNDLSASMGLFPETGHPEVLAAAERVIGVANRQGVPIGLSCGDARCALRWISKGVNFVELGADMTILREGAEALLAATREGLDRVSLSGAGKDRSSETTRPREGGEHG